MAMTSMMATNRAAPGGARQRRVAHVRPRRTESAQDCVWLHGRAPRATQMITPDLALHERASGARSLATRGRDSHNTVLGGTTERCTSGRVGPLVARDYQRSSFI